MKQSNIIGRILIIGGSVLCVLGSILFFAKDSLIVSIMSLPVLFAGMIIWYNSKKTSLAKNENSGSMIPKF